jgi:hypothetical protein
VGLADGALAWRAVHDQLFHLVMQKRNQDTYTSSSQIGTSGVGVDMDRVLITAMIAAGLLVFAIMALLATM